MTKLRIFKILCNVYLFSSSRLCPIDCLSFVHWKMNQNKILRNISKFLTSRFRQIAFLMICQQHQFGIFSDSYRETVPKSSNSVEIGYQHSYNITFVSFIGSLLQVWFLRIRMSAVIVVTLVLGKGAFKYYVIAFLTFLGPPTHLFDNLQHCKSSKIAIFWPHPPTSLMT